jgi:hypothetical protein
MIIKIDPNNPFTVTDYDGNVLFTHSPMTDEDIDGMTLDELDALVDEAIREAKCYK